MSNSNRLTGRNALIAAMFEDANQLKHYYRFIALNPHINLHDACNILLARPDATVCYPYEEWNELGRQVIRGKKSIAYYDYDGYKQYVFDVSDTRGEKYINSSISFEKMLTGFSELNGADISEADDNDYAKVLKATKFYLHEQGLTSGDEQRDELLSEGIAYSLYAKAGLPDNEQICLQGLPFTYKDNADFVKEVYVQSEMLAQEIEDAYRNKQEEVAVIDDTEEETVSDEPTLSGEQIDSISEEQSQVEESSYPEYYQLYKRYNEAQKIKPDAIVLIQDGKRYAVLGEKVKPLSEELDFVYISVDVGLSEKIHYSCAPQKYYEEFLEEILERHDVLLVEDDKEPKFIKSHAEAREQPEANEPTHPQYPLYKRYMESQKIKPNAIVLIKNGDFYEVLGENAKTVSQEINLTLTGRDVGLPERVPMCGIPQHFLDEFLNKILEKHGVLLVESDDEPMYILSHAEALEQSAEAEEKAQSELVEVEDEEPTPFDDEQSESDEDWRNELAEELGELADEQSEEQADEAEIDEDEELDEADSSSDEQDEDEDSEQEEEPQVKDNKEATKKKPEKGIKDRKRKEQQPASLFDLLETHEQSREEQMIERQLKRGSGIQHGKFRIFDKYNENPSERAFAEFLKKEYGIGGFGGYGGDNQSHDAKGIKMSMISENREKLEEKFLKWPEVAVRIADLIDADNYLTEQEKKDYVEYKVEQNRLREQRTEEERQKNELINKVICSATDDRKQRILDEYAKTTQLTAFSEFLKSEYGTCEELGDDYFAIYNAQGIWLRKGEKNYDFQNRIYLNWNEFADKVCTLIENDSYIEQPQQQEETLTPEQKIKAIVDGIVKEGTEKTTDGKWFVYFEDFKEDEPFVREHKHKIAEQLVLRKEVAEAGMDDISIDATFHLEYCPNYDWNADDEEATPTLNRFNELTAEGRAFFESYQQRPINEPTNSPWDEVQSCFTIANGIYSVSTEGHGGIMISEELAPYILSAEAIAEGFTDSDFRTGYLCYEEDEQKNVVLRELYDKGIIKKTDEYFTRCYVRLGNTHTMDDYVPFTTLNEEQKAEFFIDWEKSLNEALEHWHPNYWQAHEQAEKPIVIESENTDLSDVLDQSELGGAKTRFRNNVEAIKLVNRLYADNRNPTEAEKKILAKFVGWGGLSQAFDENNESWKKEYAELKALLSQEDYEQARSSTLNAYYTAKDVISGIYTALNRFGVKCNNRILEPSMGTGNFFGFMPKEIAEGARLYGVELDNLTGRIATKLYPQANVQIKGFEDTSFPNNKFDIVVGNVPFGGYGVADSDYNKYNFKVHDYFLAKSIDKVKPNGIVAIITSKGTMDKLNESARKYVAQRADLLGAIRLPNTAFKQTAGTEAVADILFFKKREYQIAADETNTEWLKIGKTAEGYEINQYFINHPEMVLGTLAEETGLYGGVDTTVKPDGRELSVALSEAINYLPQDFYENPEAAPEAEIATAEDYNVKPFCYKAVNGKLYMRVGDEMQEQPIPKFPKDAYQRIESMIELREELHHVLDMQTGGCSDEVLQREQVKLNRQYDLFVRRYGNINSQTNIRLFKEDGDSALLFACEDVDEETKAITKADVFSKRTIRPYVVPTNTDDCFEALQISKNERGRVDIAYIEELTGKSYDDVLFELGDSVFRNPETTDRADKYSGFETSEEYLSGLVRDKLHTARHYAAELPEFKSNVEALEQVQPTPLSASEIAVRLGQTWVDKEYYKQFYCELVGVPWYLEASVELFYNPHDSSWRLDQKDDIRYRTQMKQKQVYGTPRAPAYRLFIDSMNLRPTTIYDTVTDPDGKERRVLNQAETIAAREKQNKIKEEFVNWIFAKPERREELVATYNRLFNRIKLPSYDGSYLKFPEMNPAIELKPHQKNAVHRIITSKDSTLLHHVVGSGKTYTMAASIMKMRQLGLCKKAMVAVPNHLVQQWASEWRKLYPNAKILVATKEDLEKDNRKKFVSKVAMGDWDGIIIAQSSFAKIPISYERQVKKLQEEIASVELTIQNQWEEKGMPRGAVKNLERIKKNKKTQLQKLMDDSKKDSVLNFESLGVDYLYVDEAHYYKNLFLFSKMSNVAGISNAASQRASDLKLKCEYLQELHGNDRGVVFATGTPISNSMTEMYTMQTYLQPSVLKDTNIMFFDGWAADFGETITSMELAPSGQGYRARTRFAKFTNLPELLKMYRSFADVQTADMVKLNVPEAERRVINLKPSDTVIHLAEEIAARAERIYGGGVDTHIDNMLKVTSDGKKLALDPRCYVPTSHDEQGSKINEAAQRIHEIWEETANIKGTQIVFCDLSTPKRKFEEFEYGTHFDAYNEMKYKLVQKGIPAEEIAFIHDANTDEQKQALFDSVNSGTVRVLIGSTEKCGAGTNVQKRLIALHHLDTPYRPSDMAQREGRIIRQGNTNEKVQIFTYVTERTFDSYSYQILENKQRFISQIDRGDLTVREAEDIDETTLSYAEIKAITAANPKIKRKMEVDTEIARLRVLEGQYRKNLYDLQDKIRKDFPEDIRKQELLIERVTLDLMHFDGSKPTDPEEFRISVKGTEYTDKKEGGQALMDALYASKPETVVAEYCGFKISMNPMTSLAGEREITLTANGQYTITISDSPSGNLQRMDNFFNDLPARKERLEKRWAQLKEDLEIAKEQVEKPFEQAEQLSALVSEQTQLNTELNLDKKEDAIIEDGNDSDDSNYRILPTEKEIREVNIIDEEDKVAAMKIEVLPDYSITQDEMHEYGYKWDGMLPLTRKTALRLWGNGLAVCKLGKDDDHVEVDDYRDFNDEEAMYGIEKPVWNNYLNNDRSLPYFVARSAIAEAAKFVTSTELNYVDEKFIISFINTNSAERTDISKYLSDKPKPNGRDVKPYIIQLLEDFSDRLWFDELKYYGWTKSDVPKSIAAHIADEELKDFAKKATATFNAQKELMIRLGGMSEEEIDEMNLPAFDDELTVVAKEPSIYLNDTEKTFLPGLLMLRNEVTGEYYVINDTSAKGKNGSELEKGDTTDVETVLAYSGMPDGNPLNEFHNEREARVYFDEKVNAIRSVKANSGDYREAVVSSVVLEYDTFIKEMLNSTQQEVLNNHYKVHCFERLSSVIEEDTEYFSDEDYKALYADRGQILAKIYDEYIFPDLLESNDPTNLDNYDDTVNCIKSYCRENHKEIYEKEERETSKETTENTDIKLNSIDYEKEVVESVNKEVYAYEEGMKNLEPDEIIANSERLQLYKTFAEYVCESELVSENVFKSLYQDRGHILADLYEEYHGASDKDISSYGKIAEFVDEHCKRTHNEVFNPTVYYGKDTENRAYYHFINPITKDSLKQLKADAEMHTIAAPDSELTQDELESNHIFYLNISRDISEDALEETNAMSSMMNAMDNYYRIYPVYLQTAKYADEHYEMIDYRNSHKSNEECKRAIDEAVRENFDGMHLNAGFEEKLIEKYGMERVAFIVATTIIEHGYDGRFSRTNKEWAKTIPMSESEDERTHCCLNVHPAVLDGFADRIRKKFNAAYEKPVVFYANKFDMNGIEEKLYLAVYLDNESGEVKTLFGNNLKTEKEIDGLVYSVNHDNHIRREYTLVKKSYDELLSMSQAIKKDKGNKAEKLEPEVEKLVEFAESGDYEKIKAYYAFIYDRGPGGTGSYQAYVLEEGETEMYPMFTDVIETEEELERKWKELVDSKILAPMELIKCEPHELLKMSNQNNQEENQKMEQDKYLKVTPMGYKVLEITKDKDDRNIAIIHREQQNDYIVAARYDTSDGKWAQGEYCATLEAAKEYRYENYDKFVTKDAGSGKRNWIFAHVAKEALVKKHQFTSFFRLPTYSKYPGYGYSIHNNRIKDGRQIADMQSDSRELCYDIRLAEDEEIILKHAVKKEIKLTAREFMELVSGTLSKDYDPKPRVEVNIPKEAKRNVYDNSTMFVLPNSAMEDKFTYFIPNRYITNGTDENEGRIILSIPEDFEIKAQNKDEEEITYTLQEFVDLCNNTTADDYKVEENADGETEENSTWHYVSVDKSARVAQYENSSLFKMPKGELAGYTYYIPNGFLTENDEKGTIRIGVPEDFVVKPKDNVTGDEKSMTVEEFVEQVKNKKPEAYRYFQKPSEEAKAQFAAMEERLRRNVPEEMKSRPNWVAITTFEKENGKLGKRPIDCNTGKYASDNDPATWADFDTACEFARENGAVTLAYALDGEDKIACIDLDGCMQENGDFTELAQTTFNLGNGTYCERSVSGKGLHVFGKTDGMDLRSFSKDGDMEFYRKARFIAVTGDYYGSSELKSFDNPEMKGLLEKKFDKRPEITNAGKGVEGFSTMSDRDVYDKACAAYKGERFKALFEGQDLQNNHSNSDMSLMNLLAFWCNGDKDQMLRMFAASGLYRPEKSQDYYECTMLKALEGTTDRYNPKPKTEQRKPVSSNGSGNDGKR